ncbi:MULTISPECIES: hypothetical protein [Chitinophagaceae]
MKKINSIVWMLTILLASSFLSEIDAQTFTPRRLRSGEDGPKGQWLIYGSLDYTKTTAPNGNSSTVGTSNNASIPLGIGYFINNNDLIGVNFAFANSKENGTSIYKQNEAGFWYSPSLMLGKYFGLIGQVDAHYVWGRQQENSANPAMVNFTGFRLRAYPMLAIFLGSGWALKFKFGELSTLQTKVKGEGWTKNYIAGVSGSTFGVGISKNFDFRKKTKTNDH